MSTSVLFDEPGPLTTKRHRLYTVLFAVGAAGLLAWVVWKLNEAGQFDPQIYEDLAQPNVWEALGNGVLKTIQAAAAAIVLAVVLGAVLAAARLSDHAVVRAPAALFVQFFRAVPLLLLIIVLFNFMAIQGVETSVSSFSSLVIGLMLYNGAVLAEVFRAGINAVPRGQSEAAYGIGMRKTQVMTIVLMPQAVRYMLPAIISQCVVVLKDTSLGFVVVYQEVLREGRGIAEYVNNNLITYLLVAVIYIAMNSVVSVFAIWLERRMSRSSNTAAESVAATEAVVSQG
jgi:glutamate transport system permease protein